MTACAGTKPPTPTIATTPDCAHWKTITYSAKSDSPETIRQIIENNAARKAECEKGAWGAGETWGKSPMVLDPMPLVPAPGSPTMTDPCSSARSCAVFNPAVWENWQGEHSELSDAIVSEKVA